MIKFWQEPKNITISLENCRANCTEGKDPKMLDLCGREMENCTEEGGRILDPKMLDLCGREMTEQDFQEVEQYRLVSCYL